MLPFKGRSYLRQYFPKKLRKWELRIWRRSGFSGFLYEFDVYRGHSNKTNSTFGVSGLVAMLCSTLPKQENHKVFAENSFYQSTITHRAPQIKQYLVYWNYSGIMFKKLPSVSKKDIKKKRRGSFGYHTEENRKII